MSSMLTHMSWARERGWSRDLTIAVKSSGVWFRVPAAPLLQVPLWQALGLSAP